MNKGASTHSKALCAIVFVAAVCLASCAGTKNIPDDLTAAQLIQRGQNYADLGFWGSAEDYYKCALERYGTDGSIYVESKYELGHLYIKTKKWQKGYVELREIVQMYEGSVMGQSPVSPTFYKLAKMGLDKIPEKQLPIIEEHLLKERAAAEAKERAEAAKAELQESEQEDEASEAEATQDLSSGEEDMDDYSTAGPDAAAEDAPSEDQAKGEEASGGEEADEQSAE